jgi:outer membrane receptor protein involved in Fe transport
MIRRLSLFAPRSTIVALCLVLCTAFLFEARARAQAPAVSPPPVSAGSVQLTLIGVQKQPLAGVKIELDGTSADTNPDGVVTTTASPGTHTIRLSVPRTLVPEVPAEAALWVVDVTDIPVVAEEVTHVTVTLSPAGGIAGLDIEAPGSSRNLENEFQGKLTEGARGTVAGTLADADTGEKLGEARIYVRGAPVEAESDSDGKFSLTLPRGNYQLAVVHAQYSTQSVADVRVQANQTTSLKVGLHPSSALDDMLITAPHLEGGVASLIAERRESTAVADVIGAEQMSRVGATNAASALSRVTGLTVVDGKFVVVRGMGERYSSMLVNNLLVPSPEPTRRVVPLDLFPAGILESVVVQKSFSPDQQGEFGGGMIQLRTRGYPDKFIANLTLGGAFNSQSTFRNNLNYTGGKFDFLGIDDRTRALPGEIDKAGKLTARNPLSTGGYTNAELKRYALLLRDNYAIRKERTLPDLTLVGSVGNRYDLRHAKIGYVAALAYRSQSSMINNSISRRVQNTGTMLQVDNDLLVDTFNRQISTSGFLDWGVEFSEKNKLKFTSMVLRQTDDSTTFVDGTIEGNEIRRTRLGWIERMLVDQQVSGKHVISPLNDFQIDWRYSYARASRNEPDRRDYLYQGQDDGSFELSQAPADFERQWGTLTDNTHQGGLDLTQPFSTWAKLKGKLKAGGLIFSRKRDSDVRRFDFRGVLTEDVRKLPVEDIYTRERIESVDNPITLREATQAQDAYTAKFTLGAAYGMFELPLFERLDLMGGVRMEHANISVTSFDQFDPMAGPMVARLNNTDVLPAFTATYRFIDDFQLRAGYGRTVNRPDLRELSSSAYYDVETASTFLGQPNLKRARIDNADARLEWYYSSDEVFSVGAFYKKFDDPIETVVKTSADYAFTLQNSDSAKLFGFELEARKRFQFLHKALEQVYLAANFSWIDSTVTYRIEGQGSDSRPLQSQSPWVVNAQLGWDDADGRSGTAASLLYNISGARLRAIGNPAAGIPDQYEQPFHQLDLVLSQRLPHGLTLGLRGQNLLNANQNWKQGGVLVRQFRRGTYLAANLSWAY